MTKSTYYNVTLSTESGMRMLKALCREDKFCMVHSDAPAELSFVELRAWLEGMDSAHKVTLYADGTWTFSTAVTT